MRISFVYTNINGFHEDCYSFGMASVVASAKAAGHDPEVVIVKTKKDYLAVNEAIRRFKPKIAAFSSVSSQFPVVCEIATLIKKSFPDMIIVCGGVHPTINPESIMSTDAIDAFFVGESELSFVDFLKKIENRDRYNDTDNLAYRQGGKCVVNRLKPLVEDLDRLPYPDKEAYPYKDSLIATGYAPFLFSRGCPYNCSYCSNHAIAKRYCVESLKPRYRSPESSIREIESVIARFNIERIYIADDIFGQNRLWMKEFCDRYRKRIKIRFGCLLRANFIDESMVGMLKESGCYRISMGVESGNDHIRNVVMNRNMSADTLERAFHLARKAGIETTAINIIGLPGETEDMIWDTIRLNRKLRPTTSAVNIFYPYKGTSLGDRCFEKDLVDENRYASFTMERRETVLRFPERYKKKIAFYARHWEYFVFPADIRHIEKWVKGTALWRFLRKARRLYASRRRAGGSVELNT